MKSVAALKAVLLAFAMSMVGCGEQPQAQAIPKWLTTLIDGSPSSSIMTVEEALYRGKKVFLVMPGDRAPDSGNEQVLYSNGGAVICEFGGIGGFVTSGSCDPEGIKHIRTIFPKH